MKKILLLGMAREGSTRCPNKMVRDFNGTTIFDIYLQKLQEINEACFANLFSDVAIAVSSNDKTLWNIANSYPLRLIERNNVSIKQGAKLNEVFNYLEDCKQDYVMWVNGCFPYLQTETISCAGAFFKETDSVKGLHCIKKRSNWFWLNNKPLNIKSKSHSRTQDSLPIYESVHCFHIFNRKYLLDNCAYWDFTEDNPYLYEVEDGVEFLDIDTELDFEICNALYKKYG